MSACEYLYAPLVLTIACNWTAIVAVVADAVVCLFWRIKFHDAIIVYCNGRSSQRSCCFCCYSNWSFARKWNWQLITMHS